MHLYNLYVYNTHQQNTALSTEMPEFPPTHAKPQDNARLAVSSLGYAVCKSNE